MANYYNPYQFNPYAINVPQYQQPIQQPIRQGDYININNEQEAINYPIAPNTNLIFIDWGNKKVYEKTKGLSPSDIPAMKQYNLVEVAGSETTPEQENATPIKEYAEKDEIERINGELEYIKDEIKKINEAKIDE